MPRKVPDFIEGYKDYLKDVPGPPHFKDWAAIWSIAAAVERRCWTITLGAPCYMNMYIILIGPSGCGKGIIIPTARALVASLGSDRLGASTMTTGYLQNRLAENSRSFINPVTKEPESFNALSLIAPEMGVLFPQFDNDLFNNLTDLWDCRDFSVGRVNSDRNSALERTYVNSLFATAPVHVHDLISKNAWHGGFMSRSVMVLGEGAQRESAFKGNQLAPDALKKFQHLKETLKHISQLQGEFTWTAEAAEAFDEFFSYPGNLGGPPIPDHPNLATYCTRRHQQIEKIMMCRSAGRSDDLVLTLDDYNYAHGLLLNAEAMMPDLFKGSNLGSPHDRAEQILYQLYKWQLANKDKALPSERIFNEIHKKINFFSEAQHLHNLLINSSKLQKVRTVDLTKSQKDKSKDWYKILGGSFEDDDLGG